MRPTSDLSPTHLRDLSVSEKFATFATVKLSPYRRGLSAANFSYIMSKGNMLLGHARGKVGSLVFSRANGKQITRARAEVVKNPQTESQMVQRIILNTIAQAYSKVSEIADHSFEGIQAGQESMSYFMKRNLAALRTKLIEVGDFDAAEPEFTPIGMNFLATNTYEIAKGSLPEINLEEVAADGGLVAIGGNTYQDVINALGLQRGDQLTFMCLTGLSANNQRMIYSRVILDPREDDGSAAALSTQFINNGTIVKPSPKNENYGITLSLEGTDLRFGQRSGVTAAALIVSRQRTDGVWLRSNSKFVESQDGGFGWSMQQALDALKNGGLDLENPRFLNNAGNTSANFSPAPEGETVQVTVSSSDSNKGTASGGGNFRIGAQATVTATPVGGYAFQGWYEGNRFVSNNNPYTFTVERAIDLQAQFGSDDG